MPSPQIWLRSAIEAAAEVQAYPIDTPEGLAPPYVVFERTGTARESLLSDTLDNPAGGSETPPTATMNVMIFADDYVEVWGLSESIAAALHGFAGEHEGTTIEASLVTDEKDQTPVYLDGRDTPTYVVEQTVEIRWS
jgi:hypothetical protein